MKILALEFSSPQRSVAVVDGETNSVSELIETAAGPAMKPFALIESALRSAGMEREQIDAVAVGVGPGSYTGIRAAIALAQGWQLAREVKLIAVSSVAGIAARAHAAGLMGDVRVVIDAQREEFYVAGYALDASGWRETAALRLATLTEVRAYVAAGGGLIGPEVKRWFPDGRVIFPGAVAVGRLAVTQGDFVAGEKLEPIYLRETSFVKAPPARLIP